MPKRVLEPAFPLHEKARRQLEDLVAFAQEDLDQVPVDRFLGFIHLLREVIRTSSPRVHGDGGNIRVDHAALVADQQAILQLLSDVAHRRPLTIAGDLRLSFFGFPSDSGYVFEAMGSDWDLLRYRTIHLLEREGDKLAVCEAGDCERIFFRKTRGLYRSTRCQTRQYMRELRAAERIEDARQLGPRTKGRRRRHGKTTTR